MNRILKGRCGLCGGTFSKAAMTRHLESCRQKQVPEYWMHIEAPTNAALKDLDGFLRDIWLECCGHLSAFTIEGKGYALEQYEWSDDEDMDVALGEVLSPGMKFYHEYDFGTPTELTFRVVSEREGEIRGESIRLLARNDPPSITCGSCGKIAMQVCSECIWSGEGWLCDECAGEHECGEEMLLPVVNSPRVGMCGYTGHEG